MSSENYTFFQDVAQEVEIPSDGILSKPIFTDERMRATLFGMSAGQEMTEHTTSMEAILQFLEGEVELTVDGKQHTASPGTWLRMAPRVVHSLLAKSPAKFYLIVLRS